MPNDQRGIRSYRPLRGSVAGGWDVAARWLGLQVVGIEFDHDACETRRAANLHTIEGDVRDFGPSDFPYADGLIASPPCQTFSTAGKGAGYRQMDAVVEAVLAWDYRATFSDERTGLVLEPLRWILEAMATERPFRWIAMEQVPTVRPIWEAYATVLGQLGYSVQHAMLHSEQYGVPQTRKRAVLVARLEGEALLPEPTHSKYHTRDPYRLDRGVPPWVSMARALEASDDLSVVSNYGTGGDATGRGRGTADQPCATITSKFDRNVVAFANSKLSKSSTRPIDTPAPTIMGGHDTANRVWVLEGAPEWTSERPAPTVVGSRRSDGGVLVGRQLADHSGRNRGGRNWEDSERRPGRHGQGLDGVRVTVQEAGILQSFPADHPWRGSKSSQAQQVGNAIPPLMAQAILASVLPEWPGVDCFNQSPVGRTVR